MIKTLGRIPRSSPIQNKANTSLHQLAINPHQVLANQGRKCTLYKK